METMIAPAYLDSLLQGRGSVPAAGRGWLDALRAHALERANSLNVPTTRDEDWRHTDLTPLYKTRFERARPDSTIAASDLHSFIRRRLFRADAFHPAAASASHGGAVERCARQSRRARAAASEPLRPARQRSVRRGQHGLASRRRSGARPLRPHGRRADSPASSARNRKPRAIRAFWSWPSAAAIAP
jgi:hypothetical protein